MLLVGPIRFAKRVAMREPEVGGPRHVHPERHIRANCHAHRCDPGSFNLSLDQSDRPVTHRSAGDQDRYVDLRFEQYARHRRGHLVCHSGRIRIETHHADVDRAR